MAKEIYFEDINIGDAMPTFTSDPSRELTWSVTQAPPETSIPYTMMRLSWPCSVCRGLLPTEC